MFPIKKDVYVEHCVARGLRPAEIVFRILLVLLVLIVAAFDVLVCIALSDYAMIGHAVLAGAIVLGWRFFRRVGAEYEYLFTNGVLDIDKVVCNEIRTRLYSLEVKELQLFEPYDAAKMEHRQFDRRGFPCSSPKSPDLYCLVFKHKEYGRCMVCIDMSEELLEAIQSFLPRDMANR